MNGENSGNEAEKVSSTKVVMHLEWDIATHAISANLPDDYVVSLGMLEYLRERVMEQLVRPSFHPQVVRGFPNVQLERKIIS